MKKLLFVIILCWCSLAVSAQDSSAVRSVFLKYLDALTVRNGDVALSCVDQHTVDYYTHILKLANTADSLTLSREPFLNRLIVLTIRTKVTSTELKRMDGKMLFKFAVNYGLVGNPTREDRIGNVEFSSSTEAKGQFITSGGKGDLYYSFRMENGAWKVDLSSLFPQTNKVLVDFANSNSMTEYDLLKELYKSSTMKELTTSVWLPKNK